MKNPFLQSNKTRIYCLLLLLVLTIPMRLVNIDRVVNIDEPWWVISGSNFYYAVTHRDFQDTYYEYHPGVTNTWIIATAMHFYFPEYRGFGQGYFDQRKPFFESFLREHDKDTIELVRISRYIQSGVLSLLTVVSFLLLSQVVGEVSAFLAIALATLAPYFLGNSHLLNMESMLSLFVLVSFLALHVYLSKKQHPGYLWLSGALFGLAQLTKSTSIALVGVIGVMIMSHLFQPEKGRLSAKILESAKIFATWLGVAALVYFLVWPGMWVAPGRMLAEVYGNALSYAFQGARLDVTQDLDPSSFNVVSKFEGISLYFLYWASSTTIVTWLGLVFALAFLASREKTKLSPPVKSMLIYLALLGILYIIMFGVAQGRNAARYILNSYVAFDVISGIGWGFALLWLQRRWRWVYSSTPYVSLFLMLFLALSQIGLGLPYAPYYFNYKALFANQAATIGYGEGYSQAAEYLAAKKDAKQITAYVYNGMGTFSYYFPGNTIVLKRVYLIEDEFEQIVSDMRHSDYLVLYPITRRSQPETEKILGKLEGVVAPEKIIYIHGQEYIQIYRIADIPETFYSTLGAP